MAKIAKEAKAAEIEKRKKTAAERKLQIVTDAAKKRKASEASGSKSPKAGPSGTSKAGQSKPKRVNQRRHTVVIYASEDSTNPED